MSPKTKLDPKTVDPRWRTAIHESGHGVSAYIMNIPVVRISIDPDEDNLGHTLYRVPEEAYWHALATGEIDMRTRQRAEKRIMSLLAGTMTEMEFFGVEMDDDITDEHDLKMAFALAGYLTGSEAETDAYVDWLTERLTNQMALPQYWTAVEALAAALMKNQGLSGRQMRKVLSEVL